MAARKDLRHSDDVRKRIQTSQLINRLNDHVNDKIDMSPTQLKAAEILLRKSLPDLSAVTLTGEGGGPIKFTRIERVIVGRVKN